MTFETIRPGLSSDEANENDYEEMEEVQSSSSEEAEDIDESGPEDEAQDLESGSNAGNGESHTTRVYLPNPETDKDTILECDKSAYICHHAMHGSPCLSFAILQDNLGDNRADQYPLTMTVLGGTQKDKVQLNELIVMKMSNLHQNKPSEDKTEEEEESDSDSDDEDAKPVLECASIRHAGCVNRLKVTNLGGKTIAASWSELRKVHIWDLSHPLNAVNDSRVMASYIQNNESPQPIFSFSGHLMEGYAVEWSPLVSGMLATGDCKKNIHLWKPLEGGSWHVDQRPFTAHTDSVEDIQWSPTESNVMASCSVDKSIRIWDMRIAAHKACMLTRNDAHDSDVNVISWNNSEPFILSGGDDGKLRVWDLRMFPEGDPICTFKYHTAPITSVEWHPTDHSVFAASGADDQVTQWDLSVERDEDESKELSPEILALPPQLLFIHQGQKEIKELHWHKQMPGVLVSTAQTGFNIFRTVSI